MPWSTCCTNALSNRNNKNNLKGNAHLGEESNTRVSDLHAVSSLCKDNLD